MVTWAKENAVASGLGDAPIRWLVDDCVKFVEREIRRGNHYDGIIMDPPSYGRGPKGEIWKIEEKIYSLVCLCEKLLSKDPLFFLINSYTTGLQPAVLSYMLGSSQLRKNMVEKSVQMRLGFLSVQVDLFFHAVLPDDGKRNRWEIAYECQKDSFLWNVSCTCLSSRIY